MFCVYVLVLRDVGYNVLVLLVLRWVWPVLRAGMVLRLGEYHKRGWESGGYNRLRDVWY